MIIISIRHVFPAYRGTSNFTVLKHESVTIEVDARVTLDWETSNSIRPIIMEYLSTSDARSVKGINVRECIATWWHVVNAPRARCVTN